MGSELTLADAISSANTGLDAIKRAPIVEEDTGLKCVRIQDVNQKKQFHTWGNTLVEEKNIEKFQLKENDILIARTGGSIGANKFIDCELPAVYNNGLIRIRINQEKHNSKYIYYLLQTEAFKSHINAIAFSTSAQPNMKIKDFLRFEFKELGLEVENSIALILTKLDDKIDLNRQINQTLEQMAQALFKSWFVDFDPVIDNVLDAGNPIPDALAERAARRQTVRSSDDFQPLPDDVRQLFPNEFEESEFGWIPKGWENSSVGAEFDVIMGQSPPGFTYNEIGVGVAFFQGKTDFGFRFPINRIYCTEPKRMANKNDTLVSVRAPVGAINLASEKCCIGRGLASVRHHSGSTSYTYYAMANLAKLFEVFEGEGTVFGSINQKDFRGLPQIKASNRIIKEFNELCSAWDQKIEINSGEIKSLTKLRDTLLPKLISGELRLDSPEVKKATSLLDTE
jgi:type I restriction enzyme S subunit